MKIPLNIDINIHPHIFVESYHNNKDELLNFIFDIDLAIAEVDFTVKLIKSLKESLRGDLPEEEVQTL